DAERMHMRIMWYCMIIGTLLIIMGTTCIYPLFIRIIPPAYHESFVYIRPLLFGQLFLLGSYFAMVIMQFRKYTLFLITSLILPMICTIGLNMLLIPHYGLAGCAYTSCISYAVYFLITYAYRSWVVRAL
ncbi:MAG TPA: hypothetical protein VFS31_18290, partial [Chitinophagaceae bacterium]|nr:hypothetical protein [Chitinophagaceae bacterium]